MAAHQPSARCALGTCVSVSCMSCELFIKKLLCQRPAGSLRCVAPRAAAVGIFWLLISSKTTRTQPPVGIPAPLGMPT